MSAHRVPPLDALAGICVRGRSPTGGARLLEMTERWPAERLAEAQWERLMALVEALRATQAWKDRLAVAGPALERWDRVPLLTRAELQERYGELTVSPPPRPHRVERVAHTSGSTGTPVGVQVDRVRSAVGLSLALRRARWHGLDGSRSLATIRAQPEARAPDGLRREGWLPDGSRGRLSLLDIHTPLEAQLEWLRRERPSYLATYATNAAGLVDVLERRGERLDGLLRVGTLGESVPEDLRDRCRDVLGAPLHDTYSCVEVGAIALQCPEAPVYHVQSENVLVELLDDSGRPVPPGVPGRVVVTSLHTLTLPMIRYDLGDLAEAGGPCRCGRGLPVLTRVLGRSRNLLVLPDGRRLWPRFGSNQLGAFYPLRQVRLVQRALGRVTLEIVERRALTSAEQARLLDSVRRTLGYGFEVELARVAEIPRSPGGKFEDVVCELPAADAPR